MYKVEQFAVDTINYLLQNIFMSFSILLLAFTVDAFFVYGNNNPFVFYSMGGLFISTLVLSIMRDIKKAPYVIVLQIVLGIYAVLYDHKLSLAVMLVVVLNCVFYLSYIVDRLKILRDTRLFIVSLLAAESIFMWIYVPEIDIVAQIIVIAILLLTLHNGNRITFIGKILSTIVILALFYMSTVEVNGIQVVIEAYSGVMIYFELFMRRYVCHGINTNNFGSHKYHSSYSI